MHYSTDSMPVRSDGETGERQIPPFGQRSVQQLMRLIVAGWASLQEHGGFAKDLGVRLVARPKGQAIPHRRPSVDDSSRGFGHWSR
jgi:hypothetical protein